MTPGQLPVLFGLQITEVDALFMALGALVGMAAHVTHHLEEPLAEAP